MRELRDFGVGAAVGLAGGLLGILRRDEDVGDWWWFLALLSLGSGLVISYVGYRERRNAAARRNRGLPEPEAPEPRRRSDLQVYGPRLLVLLVVLLVAYFKLAAG